jgi:hypothetical protein
MADYAISNVPRRVVYAASGVGPYAFTFEILDVTDISVYKASALLTLTTDYTVTINANGTGEVTLVSTAGTSNITIVGAKNIQRTSDFTTGGDLFANTLNDELDNQTIFIQQVAETAERGLKAPVTDPTDIAMTLPAKDGRKGKVLAFDSTTGNPVAGPSLDSMVTVIEQSAYINAVGENIDDVIAVADNEANIDTVAGVSSAVTTVATNISNVNTVADDLNEPTSEIHVVGTNITNVNNVGNNITNVNTVGGISANVTTVAGISANVTTVAGISSAVSNVSSISSAVTGVNSNSSNINTVAGISSNVTTVAGISSEVTAVVSNAINISAVANNETNIDIVATNIDNVNDVGDNIANVNSVAGNSTNINAVNSNATNINTVAGISSNVTTVAGISANVTTVAGISGNVTSVAGNASNINQVASDTTAINAASANAATATTKAAEALASANAASASAAAASAVALGNEPVRHSVRPSLLLDFANTKTLDPRITFTRASTGTYYDGKTVAKAEENLVTYSEQFDNAAWGKSNATVTANSTTAPDGTSTADSLIETAVANFHILSRGAGAITSPGLNTFSCYAKASTRTAIVLQINEGANRYAALFDLSAGTVVTTNTTGSPTTTSNSIVSVGNGWYRCTVTCNVVTTCDVILALSNSTTPTWTSSVPTYTGDGTSGCFIWGAQLEQRSSVTAYTVTTTAPITNYIPALQTAASGVARFEHNPVTGESLGLEIEEQRTNLLTRSQEFDDATWGKSGSYVLANQSISPDGTLNADLLIGTAGGQRVVQSQFVNATSVTFSVYVKATSAALFTGASLLIYNQTTSSTVGQAAFTGSTFTTAASNATTTHVGNGWYRITLVNTGTINSGNSITFYLYTDNNNGSGTTGSSVLAWGAQAEAGSFATSYIPTVASQVTRSADNASMTGTNFSSWYRADEGTLYAEAVNNGVSSSNTYVAVITDETSSQQANRIFLSNRVSGVSGVSGIITVNGSDQASSFASYTFTQNNKNAIAFKSNDAAGSVNGGTTTTDSIVVLPVVTRLEIARQNAGGYLYSNQTIKKLAFYPRRLTNAELQGVTTV